MFIILIPIPTAIPKTQSPTMRTATQKIPNPQMVQTMRMIQNIQRTPLTAVTIMKKIHMMKVIMRTAQKTALHQKNHRYLPKALPPVRVPTLETLH